MKDFKVGTGSAKEQRMIVAEKKCPACFGLSVVCNDWGWVCMECGWQKELTIEMENEIRNQYNKQDKIRYFKNI